MKRIRKEDPQQYETTSQVKVLRHRRGDAARAFAEALSTVAGCIKHTPNGDAALRYTSKCKTGTPSSPLSPPPNVSCANRQLREHMQWASGRGSLHRLLGT